MKESGDLFLQLGCMMLVADRNRLLEKLPLDVCGQIVPLDDHGTTQAAQVILFFLRPVLWCSAALRALASSRLLPKMNGGGPAVLFLGRRTSTPLVVPSCDGRMVGVARALWRCVRHLGNMGRTSENF
jgi:hypothetical protein